MANLFRNFWFFFCVLGNWMNISECLTGEETIRRFFEYFRAEKPRGIPVANFEEPMEIFSPLETIPITLTNGKVLGHSEVEIQKIFVNFLDMTGSAKIFAPRIILYGNYSWPGFIFTSTGFLKASMFNVSGESNFTLFIDQKENVELTEIHISQSNDEVLLNLTEMIWEHELLLSSGAIHVFFDDIVMEVFRQLRPFLIAEMNKEISRVVATLPEVETLLAPGDEPLNITSAVPKSKTFAAILKRIIQYVGLEPLRLPEKRPKVLGVKFKVSNIVLRGISTISSIDSLYFVYLDKTVYLELSMRYPKLLLSYKVEMENRRVMKFDVYRNNQLNNVDVKMRLVIDPSQETEPQIRYLNIDIGSFGKVKKEKKRNFWGRVLNFFSKFETLIRREIVKALQGPIKKILQKELNNVKMEEDLIYLLRKKKGLNV